MAGGGSGGGGDIGADSERRLKKAMDKLYHFPKPKPNPSPSSKPPSSSTPSSWRAGKAADAGRRFGVVRGSRLPPQMAAMSAMSPPPSCRPWNRRDLVRRLSSFKAMTWFKAQGTPSLTLRVVSPVNCARRGWTNVEPDIITCEACGARLLFTSPSSWTPQQVEKAASVFSLKLDTGHKLLCPWIDNICDESLCFSSLLRLSSLPRISLSSLDIMRKRSPQLEQFLLEPFSSSVVLKGGFMLTEDSTIRDLDGTFQDAGIYYEALKIISLCGWEPRLLHYAVDCATKSHPDASSTSIFAQPEQMNNKLEDRVVIYSHKEVDDSPAIPDANQGDQHYDPSSVVLDCQFCGACVALWRFSLVERPLQLFKLVSDSNTQDEQNNGHANLVSGVEPSKSANVGFNFTIAGGPPPTRQSFRPRVSFPVVSRHLKADLNSHGKSFSSGSDRDIVSIALHASGPMKRKRSMDKLHMLEGVNTTSNDVDTLAKGVHQDHEGDNSEKQIANLGVSTDEIQGCSLSNTTKDTNMEEVSNREPESGVATSRSITSTNLKLDQHGIDPKFSPVEDTREPTNDRNSVQTHTNMSKPVEVGTIKKSSTNMEKGVQPAGKKQGLYDQMNEFDPIKQHRTFCPWISPDDSDALPGWRLTLSALLAQDKRGDGVSELETKLSLLNEEDDPVTSVRKLFMTPPSKKPRMHQGEKS
ncbi:hypothetical protein ZWY2020_006998 [Hordeum vulgare]|nr:hypothetical protein ZWY2020_006998 [Hordeum vulgare]